MFISYIIIVYYIPANVKQINQHGVLISGTDEQFSTIVPVVPTENDSLDRKSFPLQGVGNIRTGRTSIMDFKETRPLYLLEEIAEILRSENGCAWDREQTSPSLKAYLIEETYEVVDAIESGDSGHLREELGDLLYQVYAHSQIAKEESRFTVDDVARGIIEKLIRRHPHVFGNTTADSAEEVIINWERIKKEEKASRESILDGVPKALPALLKAYRVQQKVSRLGFDWERIGNVVDKLEEEVRELREAIESGNSEHIMEETGDILFSVANVARFLKINPEEALQRSIDKFTARFKIVEKKAAAGGKHLDEMTLEEMDLLWEEAKLAE